MPPRAGCQRCWTWQRFKTQTDLPGADVAAAGSELDQVLSRVETDKSRASYYTRKLLTICRSGLVLIRHAGVEIRSRSTASCATRRTPVCIVRSPLPRWRSCSTGRSGGSPGCSLRPTRWSKRSGRWRRSRGAGRSRSRSWSGWSPTTTVCGCSSARSPIRRGSSRCTRPVLPRCRRRGRLGRWPGSWTGWGRPARRVSLRFWGVCWRRRRGSRTTSKQARGSSCCGSPSNSVRQDTTWWRRSPACTATCRVCGRSACTPRGRPTPPTLWCFRWLRRC